FDVTAVAEPKLTDAAAVARAQVSTNPVVVEFVVVGAGAEADTACSRRRGREQFVAGGRVRRDRVVVHVHVQVMTVRQLHIRYQAGLAGPGSCVCGRPLHVRGRKFTQADADAAGQSSRIVGDPVVGNLNVVT